MLKPKMKEEKNQALLSCVSISVLRPSYDCDTDGEKMIRLKRGVCVEEMRGIERLK
jgi:hypothetical protein